MITQLPGSSGANIGFLIKGKLNDDDYKINLIPVMEEAIKAHETIHVLFKMEDFDGWTAQGAWDDFMCWPKFRSVGRIAFLVDENWHEFATGIFKAFAAISHIDVRFFQINQMPEAWEWLKA